MKNTELIKMLCENETFAKNVNILNDELVGGLVKSVLDILIPIANQTEEIGYERGYNEGHNDGVNEGWEEGFSEGQEDGYEEGFQACEELMD